MAKSRRSGSRKPDRDRWLRFAQTYAELLAKGPKEHQYPGRDAAKMAGYQGSPKTLTERASKLLAREDVQVELARIQAAARAVSGFTLARAVDVLVAQIEQSASIADFIRVDENGLPVIDLERAKKEGKLELLGELQLNMAGQVNGIKLRDFRADQRAAVKILAVLLDLKPPQKIELKHEHKHPSKLPPKEFLAKMQRAGVKLPAHLQRLVER